jgi:hypothetical protein
MNKIFRTAIGLTLVAAVLTSTSGLIAYADSVSDAMVIGNAFNNMVNMRSFKFSNTTSLAAWESSDYLTASVNASGRVNVANLLNPQASILVSGQASSSDMPGPASFEFGLRVVNQKAYGIIYNIAMKDPKVRSSLAKAGALNQWIDLSDSSSTSYPYSTQSQQTSDQTKKKIQDLMTRFIQSGALVVTPSQPQFVGGVVANHYVITMDKEKMKTVLIDEASKDATLKNEFTAQNISDALNAVSQFQIDIWVGQNDMMIHKMGISLRATVDNTTVAINSALTYSDINTFITVAPPAYPVPLQKIMQRLNSSSQPIIY